jgi:excisionase family DNA binding protein
METNAASKLTPTLETGPLLDRQAVADLLGVSKHTVWRLVRSGELPAFRVGRQIRVAQVDLENYLKQLPQPVRRED